MGFFDQSGKAFKFATPGDSITGKVISFREAQVTKYGTNEPDFWQDGTPKVQVILVLETDLEESSDDDGVRSIYVAATRQKRALLNALRAGGSKVPDEGGTLTMTYTGNDPKSKNPAQPAKMYSATWKAPEAGAVAAPAEQTFNAGLGSSAASAKVEAVQAPKSNPKEDQARTLIGMNLETAVIAQATGLDAATIDGLR